MPQVAPESVEAPADGRGDLVAAHVRRQLVERRPAILGAADRVIVLDGRPAARLSIAPQLEQLVLARLILVERRA